MTPLNDSVIIKDLTEEETETESGIVLLAKKSPKARRPGEVIAVGRGYRNQDGKFTALSVKPGDKVIFNYARGYNIEFDRDGNATAHEDEQVSVCSESNIVVITEYAPDEKE